MWGSNIVLLWTLKNYASSESYTITKELTCTEWNWVHKASWYLFSSSSVPQWKVISIENILLVFSCQEVSWNRRKHDMFTVSWWKLIKKSFLRCCKTTQYWYNYFWFFLFKNTLHRIAMQWAQWVELEKVYQKYGRAKFLRFRSDYSLKNYLVGI